MSQQNEHPERMKTVDDEILDYSSKFIDKAKGEGPPRRLRSDRPLDRERGLEAARDLLLRRGAAGGRSNRGLQVPVHRPARRLAGGNGEGRLADAHQPASRSARADRHRRIDGLLRLVQVRVLAFRLRAAGGGEGGTDLHRLSAVAEGRLVQHGRVKEQVQRAMQAHHGQ